MCQDDIVVNEPEGKTDGLDWTSHVVHVQLNRDRVLTRARLSKHLPIRAITLDH